MSGRGFVSRSRAQKYRLIAGSGPERNANRERGLELCLFAARDTVIVVLVLVQNVIGFVDDSNEASRHRELGHAEIGTRRKPTSGTALDRPSIDVPRNS